MCRVLEVSRAGYYAWRARPLCERVKADWVLREQIRRIQQQVKQRYGTPRVRMELRALGFRCGKARVSRLMREAGVPAQRRAAFRVTTQSAPGRPVAANVLARQFTVGTATGRPRAWAADITYLPTREGWLYLAVILDVASRRIVGWALRPRLTDELTLSALTMALQLQPAAGTLHHSDRGAQYTSYAYQRRLIEAGLISSMSRVGDCWDNAVVESFFATLTKELLHDDVFPTRAAATREIFEFIEIWYNRRRRHSTLGYRSPTEFELDLQRAS